jgi:hypothetical protein
MRTSSASTPLQPASSIPFDQHCIMNQVPCTTCSSGPPTPDKCTNPNANAIINTRDTHTTNGQDCRIRKRWAAGLNKQNLSFWYICQQLVPHQISAHAAYAEAATEQGARRQRPTHARTHHTRHACSTADGVVHVARAPRAQLLLPCKQRAASKAASKAPTLLEACPEDNLCLHVLHTAAKQLQQQHSPGTGNMLRSCNTAFIQQPSQISIQSSGSPTAIIQKRLH